jgi:light-regulated signal transduction histidine kinase (bacteriophytochrome)
MEAVLRDVIAKLKVSIEESKTRITHDPLPVVRADATQMNQVLQNLISNAIKFRRDEPPQVHVSAAKGVKEWIFSVKDNGIGIDPQLFDRLFILFQRLQPREKYPGTGIGLAVAKKVVQRHGGRIWVESRPGEGSTFFFTIPLRSGREGNA